MENLYNNSQIEPNPSELNLENDELKHYLYIIWQQQWLIWLCMLLAAAAALLFSWLQTPTYQATTTLLISEARTPDTNYQDLLLSERVATTYARWMTQKSVLDAVATELDMTEHEFSDYLTDLSIVPVARTQMLRIVVEGPQPEELMTIANTLPDVFVQRLNDTQSSRFIEAKTSLEEQLVGLERDIAEQQALISASEEAEERVDGANLTSIRSDLAQYQESYARLRQSYETLRLTEINALDNIIVTQEAILPKNAIRPRIFNNTWIAAVVGLLVALGAIFAIEYLDDRIVSPNDLRRTVGTPFLGAVTDFITLDEATPTQSKFWQIMPTKKEEGKRETPQLVTIHAPRHPIAEAYRGLRTNLRFSNVDNPLQTLLVTSANPGEGKSTTSANIFDLPQSPGMTDVLIMGERGADVTQEDVDFFLHPTTLPSLRVLPSGQIPPNPSELLGSQRMQQLMEVLSQQADLVIFDAPPLLAVTDARVLGSRTQGVILVIDSSQTQRNVILQAVDGLKQVNATMVGAVLNRITQAKGGYGYGYYYAYNHYYTNDDHPDDDHPDDNYVADDVETNKQKRRPLMTPGIAMPAMTKETQIASS